MKRILLFLIFCFLLNDQVVCYSQPFNPPGQLTTEEDGVPDLRCIVYKFSNDSVTDNADGTCSIATGSSTGSGWTDAGTEVNLITSTDDVEIGSSATLGAKLGVLGDSDEAVLLLRGNATQTVRLLGITDSGNTTNILNVNQSQGTTATNTIQIDVLDITGVTAEHSALNILGHTLTLADGTTLANNRTFRFNTAPTINGVTGGGTETCTTCSTFYVPNAPSGTDISFTNGPYSIFSDNGLNRFDGLILAGSSSGTLATGNSDLVVNDDLEVDSDLQVADQVGLCDTSPAGNGGIIGTCTLSAALAGNLADFNFTTTSSGTSADGIHTLDLDLVDQGTSSSVQSVLQFGHSYNRTTDPTTYTGGGIEGEYGILAGTNYNPLSGTTNMFGLKIQAQSPNPTDVDIGTHNWNDIELGTAPTNFGGTSVLNHFNLKLNADALLVDNSNLNFGTGSDVDISHDGTNWIFDVNAATTAIVFNETSFDTDFRVESNDDANMIFMDAGNNRLGLRDSTPDATFEANNGATAVSILIASDNDTPVFTIADGGASTFTQGVTVATIDTGNGAVELAAGQWTATSNSIANLDASSAAEGQYIRVGATVTGSVQLTVDPTLTATSTELELDLPVTSNFGATSDAAGACGAPGIAGMVAAVTADATSNEMEVRWVSSDVTSQELDCSWTYQVI